MSVMYNGEHSIDIYTDVDYGFDVTTDLTIKPLNTWTDLHLIPASRPFISIPQANINLVNVPGSSRSLDLTHLLGSTTTFGRYTGSWEFYIDHDKWNTWDECFDYLITNLHGKKVGIVLGNKRRTMYNGRLTVGEYSPDSNYTTITLNYDLFYNPINLSKMLVHKSILHPENFTDNKIIDVNIPPILIKNDEIETGTYCRVYLYEFAFEDGSTTSYSDRIKLTYKKESSTTYNLNPSQLTSGKSIDALLVWSNDEYSAYDVSHTLKNSTTMYDPAITMISYAIYFS